ncbi:MAG TPA: methyltransferase C-terminal domain-containing protein, partial [Planctomycetota bacterium]|nr:methyltransferase C-terminal domain-containing protein [Planctomycetota bacterium]
HDLCVMLADIRAAGKSIVGYAASAKGATLLNYCGIGTETLDYVVDRSTVKQGLHMPGSHLPIRAPELLLDTMPDYALLLAWNYTEEIMGREAEYLRRGGRFIHPVPKPRVLGYRLV